MTERFLAAQYGGDLDTLLELLAPDVVLHSDGGGKPIAGAAKIARFLTGVGIQRSLSEAEIRLAYTNGDLSVIGYRARSPSGVPVLDTNPATERIQRINLVTTPDKLSRAGQSR